MSEKRNASQCPECKMTHAYPYYTIIDGKLHILCTNCASSMPAKRKSDNEAAKLLLAKHNEIEWVGNG